MYEPYSHQEPTLFLFFHDTTAALYAPNRSHEKPIHVPFNKLAENILSGETCKLVLKSEEDIYKAAEKNPIFKDSSDLFNKAKFSDVKFCFNVQVNGESATKELCAHKAILAERSEVFHSRFSNEWKGGEIDIKYWGYEAFHAFLFYLYSGRIVTADLNLYQLLELHDLSEQYLDPYLKSKSLEHLSTKLESMEDIVDVYKKAEGHNQARDVIVKRASKIITVDNCVQAAQFADDINHHVLISDVGRFILDNRKEIYDKTNVDELDPELLRPFLKALMKA